MTTFKCYLFFFIILITPYVSLAIPQANIVRQLAQPTTKSTSKTSPTQDSSFFCHGGYVKLDDSMQVVANKCGRPTTMTKEQGKASDYLNQTTPSSRQDWIYDGTTENQSVQLTTAFGGNRIVFTTQQNRIVKITIDDRSVVSTTACTASNAYNKRILLGNNTSRLQMICGQPTAIKSAQATNDTPVERDVWLYGNNAYQKGTQLIFQGGKLIKID